MSEINVDEKLVQPFVQHQVKIHEILNYFSN